MSEKYVKISEEIQEKILNGGMTNELWAEFRAAPAVQASEARGMNLEPLANEITEAVDQWSVSEDGTLNTIKANIQNILETRLSHLQQAPQGVGNNRRSLGFLVQQWAEKNKIIIGPHTAASLADTLDENGYIHPEAPVKVANHE